MRVLRETGHALALRGGSLLADAAHVVTVEPGTHRASFPVPRRSGGRPALLTYGLAGRAATTTATATEGRRA